MEIKSELHLQSLVYQWFYNSFPELRIESERAKSPRCLMVHNFNNPRTKIQGSKLSGAGLTKGIPDLMILKPSGRYSGMFIELKYGNNKAERDQIEVIDKLREVGYYCIISNNFEEIKKEINEYFKQDI